METRDVIVIGGGPGGYVAAIRAGQLGLRALCVEREKLGGICLNWGCIPTKALLRSAEVLDLCRRAEEFGVKIEGSVSFDFAAIMRRQRKIADTQDRGIQFLFKKNKVDHVYGTARLLGGGRVEITRNDGGTMLVEAPHVIVATGARARTLPGVELDGERVLEYRGALSLETSPRSVIVIGAGAIGVEFATFFHTLGVEVTVVEYLSSLVPVEDDEIAAQLLSMWKKRGIRSVLGSKVTGVTRDGTQVHVHTEDREDPTQKKLLSADLALVAVGVQANVEGLGLEEAGVHLERGFIAVDERTYLTSAPGVYAIGDVAGPPALAHTASAEGIVCVEHIAGLEPHPIDYDAMPACTFTHPEIASVGLTERRARELGHEVKIGRFPFRALGKARASGELDGFVKVLWDAHDGRLVGAHIIGEHASDLIAEYTLAKTTEVNAASLIHTVHAHPTLAEALKEATEDAYGHAIHI